VLRNATTSRFHSLRRGDVARLHAVVVDMTVGELIEELRKFPAHRPVLVRHPEGFDYETGAIEFGMASIEAIRDDAAFMTRSPVVVIDAAEWCE
jgi:hypothetical protein